MIHSQDEGLRWKVESFLVTVREAILLIDGLGRRFPMPRLRRTTLDAFRQLAAVEKHDNPEHFAEALGAQSKPQKELRSKLGLFAPTPS